MESLKIIEMLLKRDEKAISELEIHYGNYCKTIAKNILSDDEDVKECLNDTLLNTWNSIPPNKPDNLLTYVGKIMRNNAINKLKYNTAEKRGSGEYTVVLDEVSEIISSDNNAGNKSYSPVENVVEKKELVRIINEFLSMLSRETRVIFVKRYWYFSSIKEIANEMGVTESKVKMTLKRTQEKLKDYLQKEGIKL